MNEQTAPFSGELLDEQPTHSGPPTKALILPRNPRTQSVVDVIPDRVQGCRSKVTVVRCPTLKDGIEHYGNVRQLCCGPPVKFELPDRSRRMAFSEYALTEGMKPVNTVLGLRPFKILGPKQYPRKSNFVTTID